MKEIKMPFEEYETMVNLIEAQEEAISKFKKGKNVVLVDERIYITFRLSGYNARVPKVIVNDNEDLAVKYLQAEFDSLHQDFLDYKGRVERAEAEKKQIPERKSLWKEVFWVK
jgi:hypothetical protein